MSNELYHGLYFEGQHYCYGFRGTSAPKLKPWSAIVCSSCGGRAAIEVPTQEEIQAVTAGEGAVIDKRRVV